MKYAYRKIMGQSTLLGCILLAMTTAPVRAQSFKLLPSTTTASVNGTVTFTFQLTPASSTTGYSGYDVNFFINSSYLTFVGTTPYTQTTAVNTLDFPDGTTGTNNTQQVTGDSDTTVVYPTGTNKLLRVTFFDDVSNINGATFAGPTALGSFTVKAINPLPAAGTIVTLGSVATPGKDANFGRSQLLDANFADALQSVGPAVTLTPTPAPEPAAPLVFVVGGVMLALRRRVTRRCSVSKSA